MTIRPEWQAEVLIPVNFADLDPLKVVYHGNYFRYFEAARGALLEGLNYGYEAMCASGYMWPVIECHCRFLRPLRLGMTIRVRASIVEYENRLKIAYQIYNQADDTRLTRGYTTQVAVPLGSNELCLETPAVLRRCLGVAP